MGSCVIRKGLSEETKNLAIEIFRLMDTDGNKSIDMQETLKFWHKNFAKINARAMFEAVDKDKNEKIDLEEWVNFWKRVKRSGQSEENIQEELNNLRHRGSWVQFTNVRSLNAPKID